MQLSPTPIISEYKQAADTLEEVTLNGKDVKVTIHRITGQSGSYERGLKFTENHYGVLRSFDKKKREHEYSVNHGITWHPSIKDAMRSKGKFKVYSHNSKEFAFDAIQNINKQYDPRFVWKP